MKRIVYTFAVGKRKYAECAMGLGRSLQFIGDTSTRVVVTDRSDFPWEECFDVVLPPAEGGFEWLFFNKLDGLKRTDGDQILFIDGDTLAFKRLDDIFDYCQGRGLCVQGELITDEFWHVDAMTFCAEHGLSGLPKFNGGFIYYERSTECENLVAKCFEIGARAKELGFDRTDAPINDEIGISIAMATTGKGFLIPDTMDFQNSATGLVGKLHLDMRTRTCQFICRRFDLRIIEPYLFHASRYINFFIYWRQLAFLEKMSRYAKTKPFGYISPSHKLRRSIERRILKLRGKL
jgi:hypothetical protein